MLPALALLLASLAAGGGEPAGAALPALIPWPARLVSGVGHLELPGTVRIVVVGGGEPVMAVAVQLSARLGAMMDRKVPVLALDQPPADPRPETLLLHRVGSAGSGALRFEGADAEAVRREGYEIVVGDAGVSLRAPSAEGLFRGLHTLHQLARPATATAGTIRFPKLHIQDWPRYRWRGLLLDCCRHYMPVDFVKRYIDLLALHKMNVLHWHLTEDQGWRVEIRKYPRLTDIGAWRGAGPARYGGFYSQQDIREIVRYAASRYVTVVPEIEMPGHCVAALAAYPELSCRGAPLQVSTRWGVHEDVYCAGNEAVFTFLENVLDETLELFPSQFIHIGGDECPKTRWAACERCQKRMREQGLADEHALQSWFIGRIAEHLEARGRRLIGWDEIIEGGLTPGATVQAWRSMNAAVEAVSAGHDVIASPTSHCYLDYSHEQIPLERIYAFEPTPAGVTAQQAHHILGAEGNMWTEHAPPQRVDRQVWPRLCALAEVTWSPREVRDWEWFSTRLREHYGRLDALGVAYYLAQPTCPAARVFTDQLSVALADPMGRGVVHYTTDGSEPTASSPIYAQPLTLSGSAVIKAVTVLGSGRATEVSEFVFEKQVARRPDDVNPSDLVPGLAYAYYEGRWSRLPEFDVLEPRDTGVCNDFDLSLRRSDDGIAMRFQGYIRASTEGVHTFYLTSDDGSRLWIGDRLVVDHDGLHSASTRSGQIALQAGQHALTVGFFEAGGAQSLGVEYSGPGGDRVVLPGGLVSRPVD